jgi:hypothetical protein
MGRDISPRKRNTIAIKAQGYIDQSTGKFIHKGLCALINELKDSGMKVSRSSVEKLVTKIRRQKSANNLTFEFSNKRKKNCGRKSKLTDVNINDLGFFNSLKSRVREIQAYTTDREEMMEIVQNCFDDYPIDNLDGIWGCLFNNYRSIMACDGGNQYLKAHNGGRERRRITGTSVDLSVNIDDYRRCRRLLN